MKSSKTDTILQSNTIPELRFEDQQLSSFSGLVVFQRLFVVLHLRERLVGCFEHVKVKPIFGYARIVLLLIVHFLLGYRQLREIRYYADDPIVRRVVGLKRLPDPATLSRALAGADAQSVDALQALLREFVLRRLDRLALKVVTLDFDGSVIGTGRYAEGTAVGFNRKKKGQRSYYPLFCTVAQTSQVFDVLHRSGNVHDSNGAREFILRCISAVRQALPDVTIEVRMDGAFFDEKIVTELDRWKVQYTISVPFERLAALKEKVEGRRRWTQIGPDCAAFELAWKPKSWCRRRRFVIIRRSVRVQHKEPVQLDLFVPYQYGYEFKVILTSKRATMAEVLGFHNGRGSQEGIFAELKSANALAYVPTNTWTGNQLYLVSALLAHNLARELQMTTTPATREITEKRPALWPFATIATLRNRLIQRAGRLIRPQGKLTLSMSANDAVKTEILEALYCCFPH